MKVTLLKDHTHQRKPCKKGERIEVSDANAAWLAGQGVIAPLPSTTHNKPATAGKRED